jgi:hypothetical protein
MQLFGEYSAFFPQFISSGFFRTFSAECKMFSMSELASSCRKEEFVRRQNFSPLKERFFFVNWREIFRSIKAGCEQISGWNNL